MLTASVCCIAQLAGGLDRVLFERCSKLWPCLAMTSAYRVVGNRIGELSRPQWQGLQMKATPQKRRRAGRPAGGAGPSAGAGGRKQRAATAVAASSAPAAAAPPAPVAALEPMAVPAPAAAAPQLAFAQ